MFTMKSWKVKEKDMLEKVGNEVVIRLAWEKYFCEANQEILAYLVTNFFKVVFAYSFFPYLSVGQSISLMICNNCLPKKATFFRQVLVKEFGETIVPSNM